MSVPALIAVAGPGIAGAPAVAMPPLAVAVPPPLPPAPPEVDPASARGLRPALGMGTPSSAGAPPADETLLSLAQEASRAVRPPQADNTKNPHTRHDPNLGMIGQYRRARHNRKLLGLRSSQRSTTALHSTVRVELMTTIGEQNTEQHDPATTRPRSARPRKRRFLDFVPALH